MKNSLPNFSGYVFIEIGNGQKYLVVSYLLNAFLNRNSSIIVWSSWISALTFFTCMAWDNFDVDDSTTTALKTLNETTTSMRKDFGFYLHKK